MKASSICAISVALFAATTGCLCKQPLQQRVNVAEAENSRLKFQVDATSKANQGARDYAAELKGGEVPVFTLLYTAFDIKMFAGQALPYRIDAREFNDQLSGDIVLDGITDVVFQPGNHVACKLLLHGEKIEYHGNVPSMYQGMVNDFKTGIAAGVVADLDVSLGFERGEVRALPRVLAAHMKQNGSALFENNLRDQMNAQAFRDPIVFDVRISGNARTIKRLVVTANHIAVSYLN